MPSKLETARLTWEHKATPRAKRMGSRAAQAHRGYAYRSGRLKNTCKRIRKPRLTCRGAVPCMGEPERPRDETDVLDTQGDMGN